MTITELSIKRPSLIIVIFAALITIGLFSYTKLNYELLPKFSPPVLTITTVYPGASPSEVETNITKVVEDAVSGMDKVDNVLSTSMEGVSFVVVQLLQSANTDFSSRCTKENGRDFNQTSKHGKDSNSFQNCAG